MIDSIAARASGEVGSKPSGAALSGEDLIDFDLDADLVEKLGDIGILEQHADRADQRGLAGDDVVAGECGDIAAGGGQAIDDDDQRLLSFNRDQRIVELLGAGGGAAGLVDMDDHGARRARLGQAGRAASPAPRSSRIRPLMVTRAI